MCDLTLSGGTLVDERVMQTRDIHVSSGRIADSGGGEVLECNGLHILPGVIDTQVHFREPGLTQKAEIETESLAAICGGVTSFLEMPNTSPPTVDAEALQWKLERAAAVSHANYGFFVGASVDNAERLSELERLPGTPGVKLFAGSSTGALLVEKEEAIRAVLMHGERPVAVHSEDESILRGNYAALEDGADVSRHPEVRSVEAAVASTERLIRLCEETRRPVHILHISTVDELALLADAKKRGLPVTCEVTPQHLTLGGDAYERHGALAQMNPPIRDDATRSALRAALQEGLFDVIGSDHAPHTLEEKRRPYPSSPSGMPGVQTLLPVMLEHVAARRLTLTELVRLTSAAPARLYGLRDRGVIRTGAWADLVVVDIDGETHVTKEWLRYKCGWSPFEGMRLRGRVVHVVLNGAVVVRDGEPTGVRAAREIEYDWK